MCACVYENARKIFSLYFTDVFLICISGGQGPDGVDLSQLSAEERAIIESVMAKAQELETEPKKT